jgi:hypothetical protein
MKEVFGIIAIGAYVLYVLFMLVILLCNAEKDMYE